MYILHCFYFLALYINEETCKVLDCIQSAWNNYGGWLVSYFIGYYNQLCVRSNSYLNIWPANISMMYNPLNENEVILIQNFLWISPNKGLHHTEQILRGPFIFIYHFLVLWIIWRILSSGFYCYITYCW